MIAIFTNYDKTTAVLEGIAREFIRVAGPGITLVLGPPTDSVSTNVQTRLAGLKEPVFFFGHGLLTVAALMGQDQNPAIDGTYAHLLNDRIVYATCCDGLAILSAAVQTHNATVIGYRRTLNVPVLGRRYKALMQNCVLDGIRDLMQGLPASSARNNVESAFRQTAQQLIATGKVRDAVMSVQVFDWNASGVDVDGNPNRTI
jgi:hypothetical protein